MYRNLSILAVLAGGGLLAGNATAADTTVECVSHNYAYNECYAPLSAPQLVYQSSHSACIVNRTWGFNPATRRIWVSEGCSGVFADPGGYHHGQAGSHDEGARHYDERGHDAGAAVAGLILGALIEGAASDKKHTTSNNYTHTGRTGSGYTGCHGTGCLVDNPDARSYDAPPEPGQGRFSDDSPPEPGQTEFSSNSDNN
ncbi:DUF3011 domain-containing protein [Luteimonas aestuarii]|uniref:DUF3011 domain-containing protein n=1 Tax=Luteimonas aestuarii TaxID=453837 RepID=A0A4R5U4G5_9GAMM|nr:DUF3011 domain-containing protein [Luteimonas aestuarii]TDK28650.1 DUF3011 domain-containing protein [Luteimonas aestuarii]